MWQTIAIQSQTNHTFELGPSLQEQVGEVGLAGGWDSIHFPNSQLGAVQPLILSNTGHGCYSQRNMRHWVIISCTHICMHDTCTHLGGDTDVDTSSACAHTTRVRSADNRNNKQASSEAIQMHVPVQIKQQQHLRGVQVIKPGMEMAN